MAFANSRLASMFRLLTCTSTAVGEPSESRVTPGARGSQPDHTPLEPVSQHRAVGRAVGQHAAIGARAAVLHEQVAITRAGAQPQYHFVGVGPRVARSAAERLKRGVICASAGNHAQGVALSAAKLGCRAVIVMPESTPAIKINAVRQRGGEVVLAGSSYDDAYAHALELEKSEKLTFVHPFDDPEVIAGQGTVAMEILRQHSRHNGPIHAIFCAIGGGGLAAGVAAYIKRLRPEIKVIGVETFDADAMKQSIAAGKRVRLTQVGLFADGTAVKFVGEETFRLCKELLDDIILVDTDAICAAIKDVFEDTRAVLEPAGALADRTPGTAGRRGTSRIARAHARRKCASPSSWRPCAYPRCANARSARYGQPRQRQCREHQRSRDPGHRQQQANEGR